MKCSLILVTFFYVLSVALASGDDEKIDMVRSEIMSYVDKNMENIRTLSGKSAKLRCYNGFTPLIKSIAAQAIEKSKACESEASEKRNQDRFKLEIDHKRIADEVEKIIIILADCSNQDILRSLICLARNAEEIIKTMECIKDESREAVRCYEESTIEINQCETDCMINEVDKAKLGVDEAFHDLKNCLEGKEKSTSD